MFDRFRQEENVVVLVDLIVPVSVFGVSSLFTPGPNNIMLAASGVNFGFSRTIPHMSGITLGFAVMNLAVGLGLGGVFESHPQIHLGLKYVSMAYLLVLAWKIATADAARSGDAGGRPLSFIQAAAFQWVNPKAWAIAVSAVATFTTVGGDLLTEVVMMTLIFLLISVPSTSTWALFGAVIARYLQSPIHLKVFNWSMAGLLVLSLVPSLG
jgi:threonine/homoserine/homoserine lactone efflux protein